MYTSEVNRRNIITQSVAALKSRWWQHAGVRDAGTDRTQWKAYRRQCQSAVPRRTSPKKLRQRRQKIIWYFNAEEIRMFMRTGFSEGRPFPISPSTVITNAARLRVNVHGADVIITIFPVRYYTYVMSIYCNALPTHSYNTILCCDDNIVVIIIIIIIVYLPRVSIVGCVCVR